MMPEVELQALSFDSVIHVTLENKSPKRKETSQHNPKGNTAARIKGHYSENA